MALLDTFSGKSRRARASLDGSCAVILMYHRVLPREEAKRLIVEPGMYVTPDSFALQMAALDELFTVLPLHEVVTRMQEGRSLPQRACAITFDDGWRDNLIHALPVLEANRLPATIFVVTGRVGTTGAFWPDEVSRRLAGAVGGERKRLVEALGLQAGDCSNHAILTHLKRKAEAERADAIDRLRTVSEDPVGETQELLNWDELTYLTERGVDIESHGVSHAILTRTNLENAQQELDGAVRALKERGHGRHALLAYPSGGFDDEIVRLAEEAGYTGAVTTEVGVAKLRSHPLTLPRVGLHEDISGSRSEFLRRVPGMSFRVDGRRV